MDPVLAKSRVTVEGSTSGSGGELGGVVVVAGRMVVSGETVGGGAVVDVSGTVVEVVVDEVVVDDVVVVLTDGAVVDVVEVVVGDVVVVVHDGGVTTFMVAKDEVDDGPVPSSRMAWKSLRMFCGGLHSEATLVVRHICTVGPRNVTMGGGSGRQAEERNQRGRQTKQVAVEIYRSEIDRKTHRGARQVDLEVTAATVGEQRFLG